ncbi:deoxynucleotidyltransferase terminal-interacting protein 2 [Macrotis lagotis]|uniref:deoxynucleotidyltransferase terminal-interacting protein 2 n=1 Tax=Macrotis lagotis TaxID=92651 RepID=UPI003D693F68
MVATRSMRRLSPRPIKTNESPGHRVPPAAEVMKDPEAEPRAAPQEQAPARARPGAEPATDGEVSEAESTCSGLQEPTVRITRRRRIVIPCPPEPRARPRRGARGDALKSGDEGEASEAESCSSVLSALLASPGRGRTTRQGETKFHLDPNSALLAEDTSDAESWCSGISSVGSRRSTRRGPRKLKADPAAEGEEDRDRPDRGKESERIPPAYLESISESPLAPPGGKEETPASEEKPVLRSSAQAGKKKGVVAKEALEGAHLTKGPPTAKEEEETCSEEFQQFASQSQSTPEHKKAETDGVTKALAPSDECKEGSQANEKGEDPSDVIEITENENENSDCKSSTIEDTSNKKEHLKGDEGMSSPSGSNRSQDYSEFVLLSLSSDEDQVSEEGERGEDDLCFIETTEQKLPLEKDSEDNPSNDVLFVIDKTPGFSSGKNYYIEEEKTSEVASEQENDEEESEQEELIDEEENEEEFIDEEFRDEDDLLSNTKSSLLKLSSSSIDPGLSIKQLGGLYINFNAEKMDFNKNALMQVKEKTKKELLQKTVITPDFEKKDCIPPFKESQFQLKKKRREERSKTAGDGWFGMKAPELTTELKNDLKALQMRASMDPKRFYKKNDRDGFPKYFQVGTIADNPADFYHSRIPKKQRKRTIVEELLADSEFRRYNKRKYTEIMVEKATNAAGKKFRKKKKFRN